MNRQSLIEKIRILPNKIEGLVKGLNDSDLTTHFLLKADDTPEWTVAQNVHHLADSHMNSYVRCKFLLAEDHPTIMPYDQDAWANQPEAMSADLSYSLAILKSLHTRWAIFFENLSEAEWKRSGYHPEYGTFTLEDQLKDYVTHGEGHVDQISRTLAARD